MDLVIEAGPGIPRGLVIPAAELGERFSRSSGPGGQAVNTADSRVELSFDIAASATLSETQKARVNAALVGRLTGTELVVAASEHRQQRRNRVAARERMAAILREALAPPPPPRRPTRPSRAAQQRRLTDKHRRAETKATRARPPMD